MVHFCVSFENGDRPLCVSAGRQDRGRFLIGKFIRPFSTLVLNRHSLNGDDDLPHCFVLSGQTLTVFFRRDAFSFHSHPPFLSVSFSHQLFANSSNNGWAFVDKPGPSLH